MGATKLMTAAGGGITLDAASTATDKTLTLPAINDTVLTCTTNVTAGTAVESTSGTSIDFTSIPSWVKRITVMFNGVSLSGTSNPLIQIGAGSVDSSGYVSTSVATPAASATVGSNSTAGFIIRSATASNTNSGHMVITNISGNIWISSHTMKQVTTGCMFGAGDKTLSGTLDRVRITTVNGTDTFDAGSINILYE